MALRPGMSGNANRLAPADPDLFGDTSSPREHRPARIESVKVGNFRALRQVELKGLAPLTVLVGPNGSGKSTIFDVFAFLSECFESGLRHAWDRRGRAKELRTRGAEGPVTIELKYREGTKAPVITYHLEIQEEGGSPVVVSEWVQWRRKPYGRPFRFLEYGRGVGRATSGETPDEEDERREVTLQSPDLLAVNALGQFRDHPRIGALRAFIRGWHVSYLSADSARTQPEAGPQERLSSSGDNLANVVQHLSERHPALLHRIIDTLKRRVPRVGSVRTDTMPDGRLLLQIEDAAFDAPVMVRFASNGTLKMLAYLVLLHDPAPPPFIGIEEPENCLHPRLLPELAEECRVTTERTQLLTTTHSPSFLNALRPTEVRVLWRDDTGYTRTRRVEELEGVVDFMEEGAQLGSLWTEGHFRVGDPLTRNGAPV